MPLRLECLTLTVGAVIASLLLVWNGLCCVLRLPEAKMLLFSMIKMDCSSVRQTVVGTKARFGG